MQCSKQNAPNHKYEIIPIQSMVQVGTTCIYLHKRHILPEYVYMVSGGGSTHNLFRHKFLPGWLPLRAFQGHTPVQHIYLCQSLLIVLCVRQATCNKTSFNTWLAENTRTISMAEPIPCKLGDERRIWSAVKINQLDPRIAACVANNNIIRGHSDSILENNLASKKNEQDPTNTYRWHFYW